MGASGGEGESVGDPVPEAPLSGDGGWERDEEEVGHMFEG